MINALFSLFVISLISVMFVQIIVLPQNILSAQSNADIYIAIKDISSYTLATSLTIEEDYLTFNEFKICLKDNKIVKTPGYETLLYNVDDLSFELVENKVYINITRDNKTYKSIINYYEV